MYIVYSILYSVYIEQCRLYTVGCLWILDTGFWHLLLMLLLLLLQYNILQCKLVYIVNTNQCNVCTIHCAVYNAHIMHCKLCSCIINVTLWAPPYRVIHSSALNTNTMKCTAPLHLTQLRCTVLHCIFGTVLHVTVQYWTKLHPNRAQDTWNLIRNIAIIWWDEYLPIMNTPSSSQCIQSLTDLV